VARLASKWWIAPLTSSGIHLKRSSSFAFFKNREWEKLPRYTQPPRSDHRKTSWFQTQAGNLQRIFEGVVSTRNIVRSSPNHQPFVDSGEKGGFLSIVLLGITTTGLLPAAVAAPLILIVSFAKCFQACRCCWLIVSYSFGPQPLWLFGIVNKGFWEIRDVSFLTARTSHYLFKKCTWLDKFGRKRRTSRAC